MDEHQMKVRRLDAKYKAEIMNSFAAGMAIEVTNSDSLHWWETTDPNWNWDAYTYRIKSAAKKEIVVDGVRYREL